MNDVCGLNSVPIQCESTNEQEYRSTLCLCNAGFSNTSCFGKGRVANYHAKFIFSAL